MKKILESEGYRPFTTKLINSLKNRIFTDEYLNYVFSEVKKGFKQDIDTLPITEQIKYYFAFTGFEEDDYEYLDSFSDIHIRDVVDRICYDDVFLRKIFFGRKPNKNEKERKSGAYRTWQKAVFKRDCYACRKCGATENLNAHHISAFSTDIENRYNVDNGITLCYNCHRKIHNGKDKVI